MCTHIRSLFFLSAVAALALLGFIVHSSTMEFVYLIPSMLPTIPPESVLLVDKAAYHRQAPQPGDLILVETGGSTSVLDVMRLVATGGQRVQIRDCVENPIDICGVYVDGLKLAASKFQRKYYAMGKMLGYEWEIPANHYFLLGDNSRNAMDSRFFGPFSENQLIGKIAGRRLPSGEKVEVR